MFGATFTAWNATQWLPTNASEGAHSSLGSQLGVDASHPSLSIPHGTVGMASLKYPPLSPSWYAADPSYWVRAVHVTASPDHRRGMSAPPWLVA